MYIAGLYFEELGCSSEFSVEKGMGFADREAGLQALLFHLLL